jgi:L-lactate dehydrogenase complex protein LldG
VSEARAEILGRVRAALQTTTLPAAGPAAAQPPVAPDGSSIERFMREAVAAGCSVQGPMAGSAVLDTLVSILREAHAHKLLAWGAADLPVLGLGDALIGLGFQFLDPALSEDRRLRLGQLKKLDEADVGLTGALAGLADTGTLVLASGSERARLAYLLPPVHIALLRIGAIVADLGKFLAGDAAALLALANASLALVTGPSRSGDIEMILTRGVHGPGVVHVVLIDER